MLLSAPRHRTACSASLGSRASRSRITRNTTSHHINTDSLAAGYSVIPPYRPSRRAVKQPLSRNDEPNVDPNSLRNTLEAHREANRASLIVKIAGKGAERQPLQIPSLTNKLVWEPHREDTADVLHLRVGGPETNEGARLDYEGRSREPWPQWADSRELSSQERYPWKKYVASELAGAARPTAIEQLGREIDAFNRYLQPAPSEIAAATAALNDLKATVRSLGADMEVDLVGSRATGLASPLSDIDVDVSSSKLPARHPRRVLMSLYRHLAKVRSKPPASVRRRAYLGTANVPIVVGYHSPTNLEYHLQCNRQSFLSTAQVTEFLGEFPTLRKLFMVLKHILAMRGLCKGSHGGVTSYPLIVMIVAALKFSEGRIDRRDAGGQLLFFLDMYSDIDFYTTGISFSPLQYVIKRLPKEHPVPKASSAPPAPDRIPSTGFTQEVEGWDLDARRWFARKNPERPYLMSLQDPADLRNDLGRSAYWIKDVQATFIDIRSSLGLSLEHWDNADKESKATPLLACCLGGDYRIFEQERSDLQKAGRALVKPRKMATNE